MEGTLEDGSIAISPGEERSYKIGFHEDLFRGTVVIKGDRAYIFYIQSVNEGEGNAQAFIEGLLERGYDVRVVKPNEIMRHICKKFGLSKRTESIREFYCGEVVDVWWKKNKKT